MPERLRLSRARGWRLPAGAVNVARPGRWGNPFRVGVHGTAAECVQLFAALCGGYVCLGYDNLAEQLRYIRISRAEARRGQADVARFLADLEDLRGKDLACWCRRGQPCHADVLLEIANRGTKGEG